ncbi:HAD-IIIC family phosphatase [Paenibacillus sp. DMB20]|uniref:HAD-IIIC family phosphatase n=1 Tax=Paenibacillus sp. DMB20 TaxID=1642570 RepID=UPI000627C3B7|nr:HAD-IIIC family phosphatase [Paenibacillus sp. DMB20]KKO52752.1 FkbH like protein [Paenibacillus sp. DMB20]
MIKCLIWDLDDTLWQGTLSEDGEVALRPGVREVLGTLDHRGILQSIASRNDPDRASQKLAELGVDHFFLYPQFGWGSKTDSIRKIAQEMNIGTDSLAFIDDNPYERYEVNMYLPDVYVYEAGAAAELPELPEFQFAISEETFKRRQQMMARWVRNTAEQRFSGTREEFLHSCDMRLSIRGARNGDLLRMVELASRTTQFNNLVQAPSTSFIQSYMDSEGKYIYVGQVKDRFGDHGIVAMAMVNVHDSAAEIELFCISCRMEGRGIGTAFLGAVLSRIQQERPLLTEAVCRYRPQERNRPALLLLQLLGFRCSLQGQQESNYTLLFPYTYSGPEWIRLGNGKGVSLND